MKLSTDRHPTTLLRIARVVVTLSVLFGVMSVLGGSACYVTTCDDDWDDDDDDGDDDDDCYDDDDGGDDDDDDGSTTSLAAGGGAAQVDWTLREYRLIAAQQPGAHPFQAVIAIRGFSLTSKLGPGIFGDAELQHFTAEVIRANEPLFGLPEGAGRLRFDAIDQQPDFIVVTYVQELAGEDDTATVVPDAALVFVFDLHGRLLEIDDTLRVGPGALPGPGAIPVGEGVSR